MQMGWVGKRGESLQKMGNRQEIPWNQMWMGLNLYNTPNLLIPS